MPHPYLGAYIVSALAPNTLAGRKESSDAPYIYYKEEKNTRFSKYKKS